MRRHISSLVVGLMALASVSCNSDSEDPYADISRDSKAIDAYLQASGAPQAHTIKDQGSGIRFVFDSYGKGSAPTQGQTVRYDVVARVLSNGSLGTPFISGVETKKIEEIVPEGLAFAIRSVLSGSDFSAYIPARFGYGTTGNATLGVPADAIIQYDIRVIEVTKTLSQQNQFTTDTTAIRNYLNSKEVQNVVRHESGIFYTVDVEGTGGDTPTPYSAVTFDYELSTVAKPDTQIEKNTLTNSFVWGLIQGLRIGFQLMEEGDSFTFYVPSGLAYGTTGTGSIPANANLIFKIKLKTVGD